MLQTNNDRWPLWDQGFKGEETQPENKTEEQPPKMQEGTGPHKSGVKAQGTPPNESPVQYMKYASIGTELLAAVLVGTFLGWIANWVSGNRIPWAIAVGVVIGALAGFLSMYRLIIEEEQKEEQKKRASSK